MRRSATRVVSNRYNDGRFLIFNSENKYLYVNSLEDLYDICEKIADFIEHMNAEARGETLH